eukprot:Gb_26046 [translate_table: standard]
MKKLTNEQTNEQKLPNFRLHHVGTYLHIWSKNWVLNQLFGNPEHQETPWHLLEAEFQQIVDREGKEEEQQSRTGKEREREDTRGYQNQAQVHSGSQRTHTDRESKRISNRPTEKERETSKDITATEKQHILEFCTFVWCTGSMKE